MEENEKKENSGTSFSVSSEDIKKESSDAVKQVKETLKNTDLKKDSEAAKGFFTSFFKNPLEEMQKVALDGKSSFLKIAILILVIWLIAVLIGDFSTIAKTYWFGSIDNLFRNLFSNFLQIVKGLIAPILSIAILSGLIYGFMKNKNKSFISIVSSLVIAKIPIVIASVVSLVTILGNDIAKLTTYFSSFCSILSTILLYFAMKNLSDETENKFYFWKFALIIGIFYVIQFIFSYLGIYLH